MFTVSCVTGSKLDILKHFLNLLPARLSVEEQSKLEEGLAEFQARLVECLVCIFASTSMNSGMLILTQSKAHFK